MKFQTFTKKDIVKFDEYNKKLGPIIKNNLEKNYNQTHQEGHIFPGLKPGPIVYPIEFKNLGSIIYWRLF